MFLYYFNRQKTNLYTILKRMCFQLFRERHQINSYYNVNHITKYRYLLNILLLLLLFMLRECLLIPFKKYIY